MKIKLKCSLIKCGKRQFLSGKKNFQLPFSNNEEITNFVQDLAVGLSAVQLEDYLRNINCRKLYFLFVKEDLINCQEEKYANTSLEKTYDFLAYHLGNLAVPFNFRESLHIAIIGCGGTGSNVALCLASSGFQNFTLVDFDVVQASNLNRQFAYDLRDIGNSKVICLRDKLQQINKGLNISTYEKKS